MKYHNTNIDIIPAKTSKKFFVISIFIYIVWLTFFDSADFITLCRLSIDYRKMQANEKYYIKEIDILERYKNAIMNDKKTLEKIAREKYFFKKPSEYIYIIK